MSTNGVTSVRTYTCLSGYYLLGSSTRFCNDEGNWSDSEPVCGMLNFTIFYLLVENQCSKIFEYPNQSSPEIYFCSVPIGQMVEVTNFAKEGNLISLNINSICKIVYFPKHYLPLKKKDTFPKHCIIAPLFKPGHNFHLTIVNFTSVKII